MEYNHLMLDIETMGNESFSSIVSIGAVEFDINTGKTGKEFYTNVDLQSCIDLGLIMNASTVMWWLQQDSAAQQKITENTIHITEALSKFSDFCTKDYQIWGNSANYDCGILKNAYDKTRLKSPWNFWNERDVRTLVSLKPEIKKECKFKGIPHNAIDDCKYQIEYCSKIWQVLNCL